MDFNRCERYQRFPAWTPSWRIARVWRRSWWISRWMTHLSACQQIRATDSTLPLLVLFDDDSATHLEEALSVGASGCIPEPLNPLELAAKLRASIRQNRHVLRAEPEEIPSSSDPLTKLANDRSFRLNLDRAWRKDRRSRAPVSLIVLNIDHFAQFNHLYGRAAGDDCLRRIAGTIQSALYRPDDLAAHRGSGEFAVLLSATDHAGALVVAERLRGKVLDLAIAHGGSSVGPSRHHQPGRGHGSPRFRSGSRRPRSHG